MLVTNTEVLPNEAEARNALNGVALAILEGNQKTVKLTTYPKDKTLTIDSLSENTGVAWGETSNDGNPGMGYIYRGKKSNDRLIKEAEARLEQLREIRKMAIVAVTEDYLEL